MPEATWEEAREVSVLSLLLETLKGAGNVEISVTEQKHGQRLGVS
jgi:hypothetical protein